MTMPDVNLSFDIECRKCPRLADFLDQVKTQYPTYFARPVPSFGADAPKLLIVGLAPGMHGANRTGRPFTGDYAGVLLYQTLHKFGFASADVSVSADDGLRLKDCRITNAVKCLPPENKPSGDEINVCNQYLAAEFASLPRSLVILALGNIAHQAVLKAQGLKVGAYKFGHAARHVLPSGQVLYDSYHCSRYNTQTRRLTETMFHEVFESIHHELRR
jgi:uracil-DNA glycosylase family 4